MICRLSTALFMMLTCFRASADIDCRESFQVIHSKIKLEIGRHVSVVDQNGKSIEARIVAVDEDGVSLLIDANVPGGSYRRVSARDVESLQETSDVNKIPSMRVAGPVKKFIERIQQVVNAPIEPGKRVNQTEFLRSKGQQFKRLRELGVSVRPEDGSDMLVEVQKQANVKPQKFTGTIQRVVGLPPPGTKKGPNVNAFLHPEMADHLREIERAGYALHVDLTLPFTGAGGYLDPEAQRLGLSVDSPWHVFKHEFEHMKVDHFLKSREQYLKVTATGTAEEVLPERIVKILGQEKIAKMHAAEAQGMTNLGWDETMAVAAQLKTYGWHRVLSGDSFYARDYAFRNQVIGLLEVQNRTPDQRRLLREALLKRRLNSAGRLATHPAVVVPAAAYYPTKSILFPEEDSSEDFYVEIEEGRWIKVSRSKSGR